MHFNHVVVHDYSNYVYTQVRVGKVKVIVPVYYVIYIHKHAIIIFTWLHVWGDRAKEASHITIHRLSIGGACIIMLQWYDHT